MSLSLDCEGCAVARAKPESEKQTVLRANHALNPRPEAVSDPAFTSGNPFFDPSDLVQVKYEMLRRVLHDGQPVSHVAASFGFSRPSFYAAQAAFAAGGLPGLLPRRPGPRRAHKLSAEVMGFLEELVRHEPDLRSRELAERLKERFGFTVHPRSVERALRRRSKRGRHAP